MLKEALKLKEVISNINNIALTTHKNADPDAIASIVAFSELARKLSPQISIEIMLPEGLSALSKKLLQTFNIDLKLKKEFTSDIIVIVDTSSSYQLGSLRDSVLKKKIILIDHHSAGDLATQAFLSIINSKISSTSEIIYKIARLLGIDFDVSTLNIILAGIVYDTRHFILANPETLMNAAEIMMMGADYRKVLDSMHISPSISEKIAKIKAAMRINAYRLKDFIIVLTRIGAFESSIARMLIDIGADVALVVCTRKHETRLIARASQSFREVTGIHLGKDILEPLKNYFPRGSGGGHDLAGGFTGVVDPDLLISTALKLLMDKLIEKGIISPSDIEKITLD